MTDMTDFETLSEGNRRVHQVKKVEESFADYAVIVEDDGVQAVRMLWLDSFRDDLHWLCANDNPRTEEQFVLFSEKE